VLSRVESETLFRLASPDLVREAIRTPAGESDVSGWTTTVHAVEIGPGSLRVTLQTGIAPCQAAPKSAS
jgi:hypothetical protein